MPEFAPYRTVSEGGPVLLNDGGASRPHCFYLSVFVSASNLEAAIEKAMNIAEMKVRADERVLVDAAAGGVTLSVESWEHVREDELHSQAGFAWYPISVS